MEKNLETIGIELHIGLGPPPTNSGILGIYYKDLNRITITSCGHY